jgi:hypothetical protein
MCKKNGSLEWIPDELKGPCKSTDNFGLKGIDNPEKPAW